MLAPTELGTRAASWFHIAAASGLYVERGTLPALGNIGSAAWHLGDAHRLFLLKLATPVKLKTRKKATLRWLLKVLEGTSLGDQFQTC